jgi:hypothetical protein
MNDNDAVLESVLRLRQTDFPDVPEVVVRQIVEVEYDHIDSRPEALRKVRAIIEGWLETNTQ